MLRVIRGEGGDFYDRLRQRRLAEGTFWLPPQWCGEGSDLAQAIRFSPALPKLPALDLALANLEGCRPIKSNGSHLFYPSAAYRVLESPAVTTLLLEEPTSGERLFIDVFDGRIVPLPQVNELGRMLHKDPERRHGRLECMANEEPYGILRRRSSG